MAEYNNNEHKFDDLIDKEYGNKLEEKKRDYKQKSANKDGQKSKKEITLFKYSQFGKGDLHEAVFIGDKPYFIKYVYDNKYQKKRVEIVEKIEENSRILLPPERDDYPYKPYSFDDVEELNDFFKRAENITLDQIYHKGKKIYGGRKYIDQDDHIIILLLVDAIWTYSQDMFPFTHFTEGVGDNSVGKSTIGYVFEYTAYRAIKAVSISGANYYRVLGSEEPGQCVIIEDEGDNISDDPVKIKILKSGYEYNGRVPKINMNTVKQGQKWFNTYGYKMILSEKSLSQSKAKGLQDRTISYHCRTGKVQYSIKEVVSEGINKNPDLQELYDELLDFRKLMLCYRLVHYTDTLPEIETGLVNRDNELFKPTLQLFAKTEALKEIITALEVFVNQRRERKLNSIESALYPIIKKQVYADLEKRFTNIKDYPKLVSIPLSMLWNDIITGGIEGHYDENRKQQYETINYGVLYLTTISKIFKDKFGATIKRKSEGNIVTFDREELDRLEEVYDENSEIRIKVKIIKDYDIHFDNDDVGNEGNEGNVDYTECVDDTEISNQVQPQDIAADLDTHTLNPTYPTYPTYPTLSNTFTCYKCDKKYQLQQEYANHVLNTHDKQPLYPDLALIKLLGLEPKGNPWETNKN